MSRVHLLERGDRRVSSVVSFFCIFPRLSIPSAQGLQDLGSDSPRQPRVEPLYKGEGKLSHVIETVHR